MQKILLNAGFSYAQVIITLIINIISIPVAINYLDSESYGAWILIQSISSILSISNFGIPTVLTNLMCQLGDDDIEQKRRLFRTGLYILFFISVLLIIILTLAFYVRNNYFIQSLDYIIAGTAYLLLFFIRLPLLVYPSVFISNNKIYVVKTYEIITSLCVFSALSLVVFFKGSLIMLAVATGFVQVLVAFFGFLNACFHLDFSFKYYKVFREDYLDIRKLSLSVFFSSIGSIIIWNSDNFLISTYLGLEAVSVYSTTFRLFSFAFIFFGLLNGLLTPIYGKLYGSQNLFSLSLTVRLAIFVLPFIGFSIWLVSWMFSQEIISYWLGDVNLYSGPDLFFILGAYGLVLSYVSVMNNFLVSLNFLSGLVLLTFAEVSLNLVLSLSYVDLYGIEAVACGTLLASFLMSFVFLPYLITRVGLQGFDFPVRIVWGHLFFYSFILVLLYFFDLDMLKFSLKVVIVFFTLLVVLLIHWLLDPRLLSLIRTMRKKGRITF